jgi:hypothetical protein
MGKLNKDWITEHAIDFEYKKYVLLAYLQEVGHDFELTRLYPSLSDLVDHYRNLMSIKQNREKIKNAFPQKMNGIDAESFQIRYEEIILDDKLMEEIEAIVNFSIPQVKGGIEEGRKIYDFVEKNISLSPVGIIPLDQSNGYLFLKGGECSSTEVFEYHVTSLEHPGETFRAIHTRYIRSYSKSFTNTYESIKTDMIRENRQLPNPGAYAMESDLALPIEETFLPVARRMLVKHIATSQGLA